MKLRHDYGLADGENHNKFEHLENHPIFGEFHCWLFYCLYGYNSDIGLANILRIGEVRIDIEYILQRWEYQLGEGV